MSLTSIDGIRVGHWQDDQALTGCTVILCPPEGCIASGAIQGHAPGTRDTALLAPEKTVHRIHGLCLTGGSAFGLAAAQGVMRFLEQKQIGLDTGRVRVPIVPCAVIFDFTPDMRDVRVRPDEQAGFLAASQAHDTLVASGRFGAGLAATVGKYLLPAGKYAWGGLGSAEVRVLGVTVAALSINNSFGDLIDPDTGKVVAGASAPNGRQPRATLTALSQGLLNPPQGQNTTLVAVATDAVIDKSQAHMLACSAHAGIARVIRPSHTSLDGDSSFVLSTCKGPQVPLGLLGAAVQQVVAQAILAGGAAANAANQAL